MFMSPKCLILTILTHIYKKSVTRDVLKGEISVHFLKVSTSNAP